jgi:hypothetical protein
MKNFFKRPTKTKQSNMLIDYTKWLFKMILTGAIVIGVLIYLLVKYEDGNENSKNILFTLNCEILSFDEEKIVNKSGEELIGRKHMIQGIGFDSGKLWYIEALIESTYDNESDSFKPEYMDVGEPEWFKPENGLYKGDYYFSGILGGGTWFIINRVSLEASIYTPERRGNSNSPFYPLINFQCSVISEKEYKKASDVLKKSIKKR